VIDRQETAVPPGQEIPRNKTSALLAYILDMDTEGGAPDRQVLAALVDEICIDPEERSRLISAVALSQSPDIRPQVLELLGQRLQRLRDRMEEASDQDEVVGVWSQRLATGSILAGAGAVIGGILTGGWAALALAAPLAAGAVATAGRRRLRRRARVARRLCEDTERLMILLAG
jgi:hypothetical protein